MRSSKNHYKLLMISWLYPSEHAAVESVLSQLNHWCHNRRNRDGLIAESNFAN